MVGPGAVDTVDEVDTVDKVDAAMLYFRSRGTETQRTDFRFAICDFRFELADQCNRKSKICNRSVGRPTSTDEHGRTRTDTDSPAFGRLNGYENLKSKIPSLCLCFSVVSEAESERPASGPVRPAAARGAEDFVQDNGLARNVSLLLGCSLKDRVQKACNSRGHFGSACCRALGQLGSRVGRRHYLSHGGHLSHGGNAGHAGHGGQGFSPCCGARH